MIITLKKKLTTGEIVYFMFGSQKKNSIIYKVNIKNNPRIGNLESMSWQTQIMSWHIHMCVPGHFDFLGNENTDSLVKNNTRKSIIFLQQLRCQSLITCRQLKMFTKHMWIREAFVIFLILTYIITVTVLTQ